MISHYNNKGYTFDCIDELVIITIADKMDMSYDFYIKTKVHANEWKLINMINKDKTKINKLNRKWRHPSIKKLSHIPFSN